MRGVRVVVAATAAAAAFTLMPATAQAAAYRYWTYWQVAPDADEWIYASQGPGTAVPADGAVEGWSFALTTETGTADAMPRTSPDFASVCADTPPAEGMKRVALVIDAGPASIAPEEETPIEDAVACVSIAEDATGYDVLRSVVEVRTENGLICALGGYPAGECAPVLDDAEVASLQSADELVIEHGTTDDSSDAVIASGSESGTGTPLLTAAVVGGLLVAGLLALMSRRRRTRHG